MFYIFAGWMLLEFMSMYVPPGKFVTRTGVTLTQAADGTSPEYDVSTNDLTIVYRAVTANGQHLPSAEVLKYLTPMWVQARINFTHPESETVYKYYKGKPCTEFYDKNTTSPQLWDQVALMTCPDLGNDTFHLQSAQSHTMTSKPT